VLLDQRAKICRPFALAAGEAVGVAGVGEPADGQDSSGQAQAAPDEPGRAKWRKAVARPPLDLPGPPDPADEWISLLTADPADE